jgi:hypothetical protein
MSVSGTKPTSSGVAYVVAIEGITDILKTGAALTALLIPTARGTGKWSAVQVGRALERLA